MQQFQCDNCGKVVTGPALPPDWTTLAASTGPTTDYYHLCPLHDARTLLRAGRAPEPAVS